MDCYYSSAKCRGSATRYLSAIEPRHSQTSYPGQDTNLNVMSIIDTDLFGGPVTTSGERKAITSPSEISNLISQQDNR